MSTAVAADEPQPSGQRLVASVASVNASLTSGMPGWSASGITPNMRVGGSGQGYYTWQLQPNPSFYATGTGTGPVVSDWYTEDRQVDNWQGWRVYLEDRLENGQFYVSASQKKLWVSASTWTTLHFDESAMTSILNDMTGGGGVTADGLKWVLQDVGPYAKARQAEATAKGTNVVKAKDELTQLSEELSALVVQAASLNRAPTQVQMEAFSVRYASLQQRYMDLQARMSDLDGLLGLAGTAIVDAADAA